MNHIVLCVIPTSYSTESRIAEISGVKVKGFGPYTKTSVKAAYTSINSEEKKRSYVQEFAKTLITSEPYVVVSHNNEIAKALLRKESTEYGSQVIGGEFLNGRAWIDISQLAWPLLVNGIIPDRSLSALAHHFKLESVLKDSADKCSVIMQLYGLLMRRYSTALKGERLISEIGGDTLEGLRKMIGF